MFFSPKSATLFVCWGTNAFPLGAWLWLDEFCITLMQQVFVIAVAIWSWFCELARAVGAGTVVSAYVPSLDSIGCRSYFRVDVNPFVTNCSLAVLFLLFNYHAIVCARSWLLSFCSSRPFCDCAECLSSLSSVSCSCASFSLLTQLPMGSFIRPAAVPVHLHKVLDRPRTALLRPCLGRAKG